MAFALLLGACGGGPVYIVGKVVDDRGAPIAKAEVDSVPETDLVVTNSRGVFVLRQRINEMDETEAIKPGAYKIRIRKFGYEELAFELKVEGGRVRLKNKVMREETPDIGEAAPTKTADPEASPDDLSTPTQGI
jgi:hypothetical protein